MRDCGVESEGDGGWGYTENGIKHIGENVWEYNVDALVVCSDDGFEGVGLGVDGEGVCE